MPRIPTPADRAGATELTRWEDAVARVPSDIAFTAAVKAIQEREGSRGAYARMEQGAGWSTTIDADLAAFIAEQNSFFLATSNSEGQPYIQHRGGPPGFLRVVDKATLVFADYRGNRQYVTQGNLVDNPKVHLFLMDFAHRRRVKFWGDAHVVEGDRSLLEDLMPRDYEARAEQAIVIRVTAWDANCSQHIPRRLEADDVAQALAERDRRIAVLEEGRYVAWSATHSAHGRDPEATPARSRGSPVTVFSFVRARASLRRRPTLRHFFARARILSRRADAKFGFAARRETDPRSS